MKSIFRLISTYKIAACIETQLSSNMYIKKPQLIIVHTIPHLNNIIFIFLLKTASSPYYWG